MRSFDGAAAHDHDITALVGVGGGERPAAPSVGVRALMLAMLEDALRAYLGPVGPAQNEAARWIGDSRSRGVFCFSVVCEALGLEPSAVYIAMRRMHARCGHQAKIVLGRSRPNGRRHPGFAIERPAAHLRPRVG
jgi:hypothetical protein